MFTRLFKNASYLLSGNVLASLFGIVAVILAARALGSAQFGALALILAYVTVIDRLVNFQSWQALIKYGADALHHKRQEDFKGLIKFGVTIDVGSAILGTLLAVGLAHTAGSLLGWDSDVISMAMVYSITILFNLKGAPTAVLRLFNRFGVLAVHEVVSSAMRAIAVIVAFTLSAGIWWYLIIWLVTGIIGKLILIMFGWREVSRQGFSKVRGITSREVVRKHPGIWGFVLTTNLNSSIRMATREFDILIVGGVLGMAAAGLYKIAKQFSKILGKVADPFYQAIYPELSRLWAAIDVVRFKRLALVSGAVAGAGATSVWLVFVAFGPLILNLIVGPEFVGAYGVLVWYMFAFVIAIAGFSLQPAMLAMGRPHLTFWVHTVSTIFYFPLLFVLLELLGLVGAGIAYAVWYAIWSVGMLGIIRFILRKEAGRVDYIAT